MASRAVKRTQTVLSPMFDIPEGTDEFSYDDQELFVEDEIIEETTVDDGYVGGDDFGDYDDRPGFPDIIGIVSQTIRTTPAGNQVVDVVLEVDDITALSKYEIRVTKL